jgi:hypothetical protein
MNTLFDLPTPNPKHPAKYTDALLIAFAQFLHGCNRILDPFGGTGKIFLLNHWYPDAEIQAVEIEPEWARINPKTTVGNALHLPWEDSYFDAVCTSPTYGNAMAKILLPSEKWNKEHKTITYSAYLGRRLHPDNSGKLLWGDAYREFHVRAWHEASRVLCVGGVFVLNIKNHILEGRKQQVTEWHLKILSSIGYEVLERKQIEVPSMRFGQNSDLRISYESVIKLVLKSKSHITRARTRQGAGVARGDNNLGFAPCG